MSAFPSLRRLNGLYILLHLVYWAMFAAFAGYQTALVLNRGFSSADAGVFVAIRCLAGIFAQPLIGSWADRHRTVPLKRILVVCLLAALAGALFVGVGCGLCIRTGGATGGDDALAMALTEITKIRIQWIYLLTDISVLALSACYIPLERLFYSLITVLLSGQIIGFICEVRLPWQRERLSTAS